MNSDAKRLAWLLVGVALLQAAWIWVLPPFGGLDEVDHAYRAASVARGHVVERQPTNHGRGDLIRVPMDLVTAANHRCSGLKYDGFANCNATGSSDASGDVLVSSAAARYDPAYYLATGTAARPFHGTAALYAMRIATALLCDMFLGLAFWIGLRCSSSAWPNRGLLVAATPVLLCATATAAPNGVQMAASLTLWSAGAALLKLHESERTRRRLVLIGSVSLCAVILTHTTGLLWGAATVIALLVALGRIEAKRLWGSHRSSLVRNATAVTAVSAFAAAWILSQRTNDPATDNTSFGALPWADLIVQPVLWALQTIGAVPFRNQPAPVPVFVLGLMLFISLLVIGARRANRRIRVAMSAITAVCLAVPLVATVATFHAIGFAWQGRYELPLAYGLCVFASWSLGAWEPRRFAPAVTPIIVVAVMLMQLLTVVHLRATLGWSPADVGQAPPVGVLAVLIVLAGGAFLGGLARLRLPDDSPVAVPLRERVHA